MRHGAPKVLGSTDQCETCGNWEPRDAAAQPHRALPTMIDWFGAFRAPHETD